MAGCSVVLLALVFAPVMIVVGIGVFFCMAAYTFVTSAAFPVLIASIVFNVWALVEVGRKLYGHYKDGSLGQMQASEFKRPALLCLVGCILFVIVCVMSGSMLLAWWQEVQESGRAAREARDAAKARQLALTWLRTL